MCAAIVVMLSPWDESSAGLNQLAVTRKRIARLLGLLNHWRDAVHWIVDRKPLRGVVEAYRPCFAAMVICWFCALPLAAGVGWPIGSARAESPVVGTVTGADGRLPLGATYTPQATTFSIWSPDTDDVKLFLEGQAQTIPMVRIPDTDEYTDVYRITLPGNHHQKRYNFLIRGKTVRDPYGVMAKPATNDNIIVDLSKTEPEDGWVAPPILAQREDAVIYELNVHDYTADPSSGVSAEKSGKFLGLVEHGTHVQGRPTGIDHLVDLGVTHVQIMPIFDYISCPPSAPKECYNWGYDPENYNVPEERYSQSPTDYLNRVRELKTMINEFHKSGIRVIMDVVYNHVPVKNGDVFGDISSKYFLPKDISGAGRSLDGGVPMVDRMIRDSLDYWAREYHVDGFRFDLMGVFRYVNVGAWAEYLNTRYPDRTMLIYGEPYAASGVDIPNAFSGPLHDNDQVRLGTLAFISDAHVGAFNIKYRDAIRGDDLNGGGNGGYMFNQGNAFNEIQPGSRGSIRFSNTPYQPLDLFDRMFGARPEQSVNFISVHDNLCLRDRILQWAKDHGRSGDAGFLKRLQEFGTGIILTSQGIPFISEGDEFLRDKNSLTDRAKAANSFNVPDPVNTIHWDLRAQHEDVYNYFKKTIALRRAHPGFRVTSWEAVNRNITTSVPRGDVVVNDIKSADTGDPWSEIIVIYNSGNEFTFALPGGTWQVAMERSQAVDQERSVTGSVIAEGTAVTVVHR
jgi:pullulanase